LAWAKVGVSHPGAASSAERCAKRMARAAAALCFRESFLRDRNMGCLVGRRSCLSVHLLRRAADMRVHARGDIFFQTAGKISPGHLGVDAGPCVFCQVKNSPGACYRVQGSAGKVPDSLDGKGRAGGESMAKGTAVQSRVR
jgi:hypothetical protein